MVKNGGFNLPACQSFDQNKPFQKRLMIQINSAQGRAISTVSEPDREKCQIVQ